MPAIGDHLRRELVTFVGRLRAAGVPVPADGSIAAAEALTALPNPDRDHVAAALRASLCSRPADREAFDRLFPVFWARVRGSNEAYPEPTDDGPVRLGASSGAIADTPTGVEPDADVPEEGISGSGVPEATTGESGFEAGGTEYSPDGRSRPVTVGPVSPVDVSTAVADLGDAIAARPDRRFERGRGGVDLRRAMRRSLASGGVPLPVPERARARTAARGVVLVDVSESVLDAVDVDLLFATCYAMRSAWRRTPIYFFDTELRDVSRAFDGPSAAAARDALAAAGVEWGGGTRIAKAVAALRERAPEAVDRRTGAIVISDGLERGDVADVRDAFAWLSRRAGAVLWLHPLAGDPAWSPSAPGMRAALPYVDRLAPFDAPADLSQAARDLTRGRRHASIGPGARA